MAVRADPTEAYREPLLVAARARPGSRGGLFRFRGETGLAYAILTPTFLVILGLVAYPFTRGGPAAPPSNYPIRTRRAG